MTTSERSSLKEAARSALEAARFYRCQLRRLEAAPDNDWNRWGRGITRAHLEHHLARAGRFRRALLGVEGVPR